MDDRIMGQRIRLVRRQRNLTQAQLAKMIDVSTSCIGHIERGSRRASLETLTRVCETLQISMDSIVMPLRDGMEVAGLSAEQIKKAHALLQAALDMCK